MTRLDVACVERGLVRSRSRAQALINAGHVQVNGVVVTKPGLVVSDDVLIIANDSRYVSRAAHKLLDALDLAGIQVSGRALDAGASTGGFTQVLLERGCEPVYAVDVGHDQLVPSLRNNPRVRVREGLNLRNLTVNDLDGKPVDVITADVSFISLTLLIGPLFTVAAADAFAVLLVKPQFEVGKSRLGKGGVVKDAEDRHQAIAAVRACVEHHGWQVTWQHESTVTGQDGNREEVLIARPG